MVPSACRLRSAALLTAAVALGFAGCGDGSGETPAGRGGGGPSDAGGASAQGCRASARPESGEHAIEVAGGERRFIVRVPEAYDPELSYALVFAWHGFTGSAAGIAAADGLGNNSRFLGLEPRARGRAIFVAGQGLDTTLLGQTAPGWDNRDGRDVAFVRALLEWLSARYLATADLARRTIRDLAFATHDQELGIAARGLGFRVLGA